MGMNQTPSGERVHIGFFGRRNVGKSSLVNAVTGQELAVVSATRGTTTDPVSKAMEILPLGPVMIIDTPGIDDEGALGELRVKKTRQVLNKTDIAVLVLDLLEGICTCDKELVALFLEKKIPFVFAWNKNDLLQNQDAKVLVKSFLKEAELSEDIPCVIVSAENGEGVNTLRETMGTLVKTEDLTHKIVGGLIKPGDLAVLVVPIDSAAPKGRLILPQQQVIRDVLEEDAVSIVVKENGLKQVLEQFGEKTAVVITDSQAFSEVAKDTPEQIPLTSFSILMARYKGYLEQAVRGIAMVDQLQDGDHVLISEGCTHHRQCDDIGTVKIPRWLKQYTGKELVLETSSGHGFPEDLSPYSLIIHCGACMLSEREVKYRMKCAEDAGVPMTNYGIAIAYMKGILKRSLSLFPELMELLPDKEEV